MGGLNLETLPAHREIAMEDLVAAIKNALQYPTSGIAPFQIPRIQCPADQHPTICLINFIKLLRADAWLDQNAIIVCFDGPDAARQFGLALGSDIQIWQSKEALQYLQSSCVNIYSLDGYETAIRQILPN